MRSGGSDVGGEVEGIRITLRTGKGQDLRADDGGRAMHLAEVRQRQLRRLVSLLLTLLTLLLLSSSLLGWMNAKET